MAKLANYDLSDVETRERTFTPYDGPVPKRGLYNARVTSATVAQSSAGNDMITVIVELTDKPYVGAPLWQYIVFSESALWRARQVLEAFGLPIKGNLEKWAKLLQGKKCQVRVKNETYEGELQAKIADVLPPKKGGTIAAEDEDEDEVAESEENNDSADDAEETPDDEDDEDAEEGEDEDSGEEEEEEPPAPVKSTKSAAVKKAANPARSRSRAVAEDEPAF